MELSGSCPGRDYFVPLVCRGYLDTHDLKINHYSFIGLIDLVEYYCFPAQSSYPHSAVKMRRTGADIGRSRVKLGHMTRPPKGCRYLILPSMTYASLFPRIFSLLS